jgi:integrase
MHGARYGCTEGDHECTAPFRARVWVHTSTGERVRKVVYGTTQGEVLRKVKALNVAEAKGQVVRASGLTVEQWLAAWYEEAKPGLKVNTRKGYETYMRNYLVPHVGRHQLDRLTPDHVARMYRDLAAKGLSAATVRGVHAILRRSLKVAVRRGKVARNVCEMVDPPSIAHIKPKGGLPLDDAWAVLRTAGDDPRFWLALLTGMRQGEALGLRWCDLYLDVPEGEWPFLVVRQALSWVRGEGGTTGPVFDTPKSAASTDREVPLVPALADRLRKHRDKAMAAGAKDADLVFANQAGRPQDPRRDHDRWLRLVKRAGVEGHYTLHQARNTTAGLLELAGVPDRVVAEILGHSQVSMTHHYQRGNAAPRLAAMQALSGYVAAALEAGEGGAA